MKRFSEKTLNLFLIFLICLLVVGALMLNPGSEFGGADGSAEEIITDVDPGYEPWFAPFWEPPGAETESLLFSLQAALGSGIFAYGLGYFAGQRKKKGDSP